MAMAKRGFGSLALSLGLAWLATTPVNAASSSSSSTPAQTSSAPAATHTVQVAPDGFTFKPESIQANVSDVIQFIFFEGNHSVVRAEYEYPCIPYENLGGGRVGFFSGFIPTSGSPGFSGPTWNLTINSTEPIFFYCAADGACVPNGMIGVINPNSTQTLDVQTAFTKNATYQLYPGQQAPSEAGPSATPTPAPSGGGGGLHGGAIAGIVVGVLAVLALGALACYLVGRNRSLASIVRYSQPPQKTHTDLPPPMEYHHQSPSTVPGDFGSMTSPKPALPSPNMSHHDSWHAGSMVEHGGMGSPGYVPGGPPPGQWSPGFGGQQQYSPVPQNMYGHQEMSTGQEHHLPSGSPGYMQGQDYLSAHTSPHHSMVSPPLPSMSPPPQQQHPGTPPIVQSQPAEMDATITAPYPTGSPPPDYVGRSFSFAHPNNPAERPGVEKLLRTENGQSHVDKKDPDGPAE